MPNSVSARSRNLSIEFCKLIAAIFVVFIHEPFPREYGELVAMVGRFAVPFFFAVSGYFNYGARQQDVSRRFLHIIKLNLLASGLYFAYNVVTALGSGYPLTELLFWDSIVPRLPALTGWVLLQLNPFCEVFWYLASLALCYLVLWLYLGFWKETSVDYRPAYFGGFVILAFLFFTGCVMPWAGHDVPVRVYRNGWVEGLSMFTLGLFLHQYQDVLFRSFDLNAKRLSLLALIGTLLSVAQWRSGVLGEAPAGIFLQVPALILLCTSQPLLSHPGPAVQAMVSRFGVLSTGVYILHPAILRIYNEQIRPGLEAPLGSAGPWLQPVFALILSLAAALIWERVDWMLGGHQRKSGSGRS